MSNVISMLHPLVRKLWEERGFSEPTPPQKEAIPLILSGENVLIVAPTGSGKTEAAFLPVLSMMLGTEDRGVKVLYVTPLRTLNRDILSRLEWWTLKLGLRILVRHGDTPPAERRVQAMMPPEVLVTTPETLQLLLVGKKLRNNLKTLKWVIVDEVHEVADSKRGVQLSFLLEKVRRVSLNELQVIGLSATVGNPEEVAKLLVGASRSCKVIYVPVRKLMKVEVVWPDTIEEDFELAEKVLASPDVASRVRYIAELINQHKSTLVFSNTRPTAEMLSSRFKLWNEKFPVYVHHGSLSQSERGRIEEKLRKGEVKGVVCTSSMELGIDIGHVDLVVQYNSPREVRRLVQRVGRAGHSLDRLSRGVIVVGDSDDALESIVLKTRLEKELVEPSQTPLKPLDVLAHELIGLAISDSITIDEAYRLVTSSEPFKNLDFEELKRVIEFMESIGLLRIAGERLKPASRRSYEYFFTALSTIPDVKQYYVIDRSTGNPAGLLDDYFVSEYCEVGARFIVAGRPWEVVSLSDDAVYVEPVNDYSSAIPSWVGEEIPVPIEVAKEVGKLRGFAGEKALQGVPLRELAEQLANEYGVGLKIFEKSLGPVYETAAKGFPVPSDRLILVEEVKGGIVVVHAHFGNRVNIALGKYLAYKLAHRVGIPIYSSEKPYRIVIRCEGIGAGEVARALEEASEEDFIKNLRAAIEDSRAFRWRLQQVARRMGVIASDARLTRGDLDRIATALKDTPVYEEALKEVMQRDLDVSNALTVISEVRKGKVAVVTVNGPTPLTIESERALREGLEPSLPERRELLSYALFKAKLLQSFAAFYCVECGAIFERSLAELEEDIECPYCGSNELAFDTVSEEEMMAKASKCLKAREKRDCRFFWTSIEVLRNFKSYGVLARAAGLSFREIMKLLSSFKGDKEAVFKAVWVARKEKIRSSLEGVAYRSGVR
ncbi:MAG: DEAD/DEAH box helicase [Thermofilaceae archaeon]